MALIEYDAYKQKLRDLEPELKKLGDALDIDAVAQEAARLEDETTQDGFWNNLERSQKVQTRLKQLQNKLHRFKKLMSTWEDLTTLCEMGQEAEDEEILEELKTEFPALETEIEEIRMTTLLSGEYDANNVILQLHSGAGGTHTRDWGQRVCRECPRRYQICRYFHRGRECLRPAEERTRRPPSGPRVPLRCQRPPSDQFCRCGGHAGAA